MTKLARWHAALGLAVGIVCALSVLLAAPLAQGRRALAMGLAGLVIAGTTAWVPYDVRTTARALPAIHDITTDRVDPPPFVRVAALRTPHDHPVTYDGAAVGEQQEKAYPDLSPLVLKAPPAQVFAAAQSALVAMGLEIVQADAAKGHIEATATSLLFGFKDDVVVRIAGDSGGTKVDMRSKSRVGRHDFGMNAKRVRMLLDKLKATAG